MFLYFQEFNWRKRGKQANVAPNRTQKGAKRKWHGGTMPGKVTTPPKNTRNGGVAKLHDGTMAL